MYSEQHTSYNITLVNYKISVTSLRLTAHSTLAMVVDIHHPPPPPMMYFDHSVFIQLYFALRLAHADCKYNIILHQGEVGDEKSDESDVAAVVDE